jgi:hypothetical protein
VRDSIRIARRCGIDRSLGRTTMVGMVADDPASSIGSHRVGAAPFILLQRTQLQSEEVCRALLWLGLPYVPVGLQLEGWWGRRTIERAYVREIDADFRGIEQICH